MWLRIAPAARAALAGGAERIADVIPGLRPASRFD
jgi:hypothetical protein